MHGAEIRDKLRNGQRVYGTHIVSFGSSVNARFTANLDVDFIFICTEHIPVDRTEVAVMCQYYGGRGISPMVRIPYPSGRWASMAIEGGALLVTALCCEPACATVGRGRPWR